MLKAAYVLMFFMSLRCFLCPYGFLFQNYSLNLRLDTEIDNDYGCYRYDTGENRKGEHTRL